MVSTPFKVISGPFPRSYDFVVVMHCHYNLPLLGAAITWIVFALMSQPDVIHKPSLLCESTAVDWTKFAYEDTWLPIASLLQLIHVILHFFGHELFQTKGGKPHRLIRRCLLCEPDPSHTGCCLLCEPDPSHNGCCLLCESFPAARNLNNAESGFFNPAMFSFNSKVTRQDLFVALSTKFISADKVV